MASALCDRLRKLLEVNKGLEVLEYDALPAATLGRINQVVSLGEGLGVGVLNRRRLRHADCLACDPVGMIVALATLVGFLGEATANPPKVPRVPPPPASADCLYLRAGDLTFRMLVWGPDASGQHSVSFDVLDVD